VLRSDHQLVHVDHCVGGWRGPERLHSNSFESVFSARLLLHARLLGDVEWMALL
jgi:hypothetical protein